MCDLAELDDHLGAFGLLFCLLLLLVVMDCLSLSFLYFMFVFVLIFILLAMFLLLLFNLKDRLITPGDHSLDSFLLILFNFELVDIESMGPLFATRSLQV